MIRPRSFFIEKHCQLQKQVCKRDAGDCGSEIKQRKYSAENRCITLREQFQSPTASGSNERKFQSGIFVRRIFVRIRRANSLAVNMPTMRTGRGISVKMEFFHDLEADLVQRSTPWKEALAWRQMLGLQNEKRRESSSRAHLWFSCEQSPNGSKVSWLKKYGKANRELGKCTRARARRRGGKSGGNENRSRRK